MKQRILTEQLWERIIQAFQVSHSQSTRFLKQLDEEDAAEVNKLRATIAEKEAEIAKMQAVIDRVYASAPAVAENKIGAVETVAPVEVAAAIEENEVAAVAAEESKVAAEAEEKCGATLKSGTAKGGVCGKKCAPGTDRCPAHARCAVPEGEACEYVFGKGPKKDTVCGKKRCADSTFCSEHQRPSEKSATKSQPKEEKPKKEGPKESPKKEGPKEEKPVIRAVRRGALVVIKGTDFVIDDEATKIIGRSVLRDECWMLVEEWAPEMAEAMETYKLSCEIIH